ncbi:HAD family hydrolase [Sphingobium boeckii]|uniref:FMN phosphatase YigB (HAD superfamily) n=1 Tax=Sphingobium boeckii TaxID=1082345 RepID=A0A7W9AEY8_9SPHN|nr:HAD family hydrolase [Sphingobium boeckii]MBB5684375.1 FMN phosphatase YigB (HAD superfamily) [Sphingobium boeckii]
MSRPLLITDCDEVLLHMVSHFGNWLGEAHAIDFTPDGGDFSRAMKRRADGSILSRTEMWPLLGGFFDTEMHRQTLVPHAKDALDEIADYADVVILTNLEDHRQAHRMAQLRAFGIDFRVVTNQGGKGTPVKALLAEYAPSAAVFVDDLAVHHQSVSEEAPAVWRLHMISEPSLAPSIPPAPAAHVRIDDWVAAKAWISGKLLPAS